MMMAWTSARVRSSLNIVKIFVATRYSEDGDVNLPESNRRESCLPVLCRVLTVRPRLRVGLTLPTRATLIATVDRLDRQPTRRVLERGEELVQLALEICQVHLEGSRCLFTTK